MPSIKLCNESSDYIDQLMDRLNLKDRVNLLKLSFAYGLSTIYEFDHPKDSKGREINLSVIESSLYNALINQVMGKRVNDEEKRKYYKEIIDRGSLLLRDKEKDVESLLIELTKESLNVYQIGSKINIKGSTESIVLELGIDDDNNDVNIQWNNFQCAQHLGITGTTGAGKTQLSMEILSQIYEKSNGKVHIIFFDYAKGDVADNNRFVRAINADVIDVSQGIEYNPFFMDSFDRKTVEELKDIITSVQSHLGPKQGLTLFRILEQCYKKYGNNVDLYQVYDYMKKFYDENNKAEDVLVELFHKLEVMNIFPTSEYHRIDSFLGRNIILDLHAIDSQVKAKELIVFLILNKIYKDAINQNDSEIKSNSREIRTVVVIDEAHNYLGCKNIVLQRMLRELRSKGIALFLLTQNASDFDQKGFDYTSMFNWTFLMKSDNDVKDIEKTLAVNRNTANRLRAEISNCNGGIVYSKKLFEDQEYSRLKSKLFYQRK